MPQDKLGLEFTGIERYNDTQVRMKMVFKDENVLIDLSTLGDSLHQSSTPLPEPIKREDSTFCDTSFFP